jgi:hypothetical protein
MNAGEESWTYDWGVNVDLDRTVYLNKFAPLLEKKDSRAIKVQRDEHGAYHLDLRGAEFKAEQKNLESERRQGLILPVESVVSWDGQAGQKTGFSSFPEAFKGLQLIVRSPSKPLKALQLLCTVPHVSYCGYAATGQLADEICQILI